jgi:hypothetical protein
MKNAERNALLDEIITGIAMTTSLPEAQAVIEGFKGTGADDEEYAPTPEEPEEAPEESEVTAEEQEEPEEPEDDEPEDDDEEAVEDELAEGEANNA